MDEQELRGRFHRALDGDPPTPGFFERAMAALPDRHPPATLRRAMTGLAIAAGVVLVVGLGVALRANPLLPQRVPGSSATPPTEAPGPRDAAAVAYDAARRVVVMFGGPVRSPACLKLQCLSNDTWTWDGANWRKESPARAPSPRLGAAMAYDPALRQIVLFGGSTGNDKLGDTWTWDGRSWTQQHPARSPAPRIAPAMAYDEARAALVLFGGGSSDGLNLTDTWTWKDNTWVEQHPDRRPPSAWGAGSMVFYGRARSVLLFTSGPTGAGQTWSWDGKSWTQLDPSATPSPARSSVSLAYDARSQEVVLFGGTWGTGRTGGTLNDTWTWVGKTWARQQPPLSPPPADQLGATPGMAYDAARERVLLFTNGETWLWDGKTWAAGDAAARATAAKQRTVPKVRGCQTPDLKIRGGYAGGVSGGGVAGSIRFTNQSSTACALVGRPQIQLNDARGLLPVIETELNTGTSEQVQVLQPGQEVSVSFVWSNYCQPTSGTITLSVRLSDQGELLTTPADDLSGHPQSGTPRCVASGPSTLAVGPYEAEPR